MSGVKCKNCNSTEIETDPARGDAVCTACGFILEDQVLVSHTAFEETSSGGMMVLGQFVASDSTGGVSGFGGSYHLNGRASREITIQNAQRGISHLCKQLKLKDHFIAMSVNFYKQALGRDLTRGRKHVLNHAACVYITCRTEQTPHLLIDISDILQLDVNELGRTYLKFARALCINIPTLDPWIYITRFANKLEFSDQAHQVSTTAQRLVQRMKRDSIHTGRRPSGVCGAALLIAARLHGFNRTAGDIVKVVHVHESTLRKRMLEFGETPSSALTLDEFMNVDLEEEQDPPAFKAARKKDRERLQNIDDLDTQMDDLQNEINRQLERQRTTKSKRKHVNSNSEDMDTDRFIQESTMNVIQSCVEDNVDDPEPLEPIGLGPNIASMNLPLSIHEQRPSKEPVDEFEDINGEFDATGIDDDELDRYILSEQEFKTKSDLWEKVNETYLKEQQEKEEKRLKDLEEGKPEKKKRRARTKKKDQGPANSAGEAIEKMLQEKRISSKINYEVLKSLTVGSASLGTTQQKEKETPVPEKPIVTTPRPRVEPKFKVNLDNAIKRPAKVDVPSPVKPKVVEPEAEVLEEEMNEADEDDMDEDDHDEEEEEEEMSVIQMLRQEFGHGNDDDEYDYGDEEY